MRHPLTPKFVGPIIAFFLVSFLFKGIAVFVHRKVDYHYKYRTDETQYAFWERLNRRLGACLGALNGLIYFLVLALVVSVFGYYAIQTGAAESEAKVMSFLGKSAEDLKATRMDKVVAPFNPMPEQYFDAVDIGGMFFHNRQLLDRLENYPLFAAWGERPEFQAMAGDAGLQQALKAQTSFSELLENSKIQQVATNAELMAEVMKVDFKDLKQYVETGVSAKFEKEKLLGRWSYDLPATLKLNKERNPDMTASTWTKLSRELTERMRGSVFTAFYNNKAALKLSAQMDGRGSPLVAIPPVRTATGIVISNAPSWLTTNASFSATGKWSGSAPGYLITLGNKNGMETSESKLEDTTLAIYKFEGKALSFTKIRE